MSTDVGNSISQDPVPNVPARRRFLEKCIGAIGSLGLMGVMYPIIRYLEPPPEAKGAATVEIAVESLPPESALAVTYRGRPAVVVNGPHGLVAFSAVCSHLGCAVKWVRRDQEFVCPCHGGRFDARGRVVGGPPPAPLMAIPVSSDGSKVVLGT